MVSYCSGNAGQQLKLESEKKETMAVKMAAPGKKLQCLQQQRPESTTDRIRQDITEVRRIRHIFISLIKSNPRFQFPP